MTCCRPVRWACSRKAAWLRRSRPLCRWCVTSFRQNWATRWKISPGWKSSPRWIRCRRMRPKRRWSMAFRRWKNSVVWKIWKPRWWWLTVSAAKSALWSAVPIHSMPVTTARCRHAALSAHWRNRRLTWPRWVSQTATGWTAGSPMNRLRWNSQTAASGNRWTTIVASAAKWCWWMRWPTQWTCRP